MIEITWCDNRKESIDGDSVDIHGDFLEIKKNEDTANKLVALIRGDMVKAVRVFPSKPPVKKEEKR